MMNYLTVASAMPSYMVYPRFLMGMELSETEKLVYVVLLDRARLSMSNDGWTDESGHVFLIYPIKALSETLHKSEMTVKTALAVLEKKGLILRKRQGQGQPNHIYVMVQRDNSLSPGETENYPPDGQKAVHERDNKLSFQMDSKLSTNKNNRVGTMEQEQGSNKACPAYGQFQNVYLTDGDIKRLRQTIPNYQEYIERLSSYMASTGKTYKDHAATIQSWALRDKPAYKVRSYDYKEGESL